MSTGPASDAEGVPKGRVGFTEDYRSAKTATVAFDRSGRGRLRLSGRAPGQMLEGVLTGRIPTALSELPGAPVARGTRAYSAILTPKGKMLSDLYLYRLPGEAEEFVIDVPVAGLEPVVSHFGKVLPPRLARFEDVAEDVRFATIAGPGSAAAITSLLGIEEAVLTGMAPDDVIAVDGFIVARSADLSVSSFDVLVPSERWDDMSRYLDDSGAAWAGSDVWQVLRLEAGTPEFGTDMGPGTIPIEAGIDDRAVDHDKGCYTGQEVIVRIRHRGHVNRHLRTLTVSDGGIGPGDALYRSGEDKAVGEVTSSAVSPDAGCVLALAYVRREVEPGSELQVGGPGGPHATVRERGPIT